MSIRLLAAALSGCALLLPSVGGAQPRSYSVAEIATDMAFGFCPLFLAGSFPLTGPRLEERGFAPAIETQQNPRFGEVRMVTAKRDDGTISFGGAAGKVCTVVVTGGKRVEALAGLRERMSWTGLEFAPEPYSGAAVPGVKVESFAAPVEKQLLHVQLVESGGESPFILAQLYATEK